MTPRPIEIAGVRIGMAACMRVDQGADRPLTLTECLEAVQHPTKGAKRHELVETIAYLAAQVVGYQRSVDREGQLAMSQVARIVDEYRRVGGA